LFTNYLKFIFNNTEITPQIALISNYYKYIAYNFILLSLNSANLTKIENTNFLNRRKLNLSFDFLYKIVFVSNKKKLTHYMLYTIFMQNLLASSVSVFFTIYAFLAHISVKLLHNFLSSFKLFSSKN